MSFGGSRNKKQDCAEIELISKIKESITNGMQGVFNFHQKLFKN